MEANDETWLVQGELTEESDKEKEERSRSPERLLFKDDDSDGEKKKVVNRSRKSSIISTSTVGLRRDSTTAMEWERQKGLLERDADAARSEKEIALRKEKSTKQSLHLQQRLREEDKNAMSDKMNSLQAKIASLKKQLHDKDQTISNSKLKWKMTEEEMQQLRLEYWEWKDQVGVARITQGDDLELLAETELQLIKNGPKKWPILEKYMFNMPTPTTEEKQRKPEQNLETFDILTAQTTTTTPEMPVRRIINEDTAKDNQTDMVTPVLPERGTEPQEMKRQDTVPIEESIEDVLSPLSPDELAEEEEDSAPAPETKPPTPTISNSCSPPYYSRVHLVPKRTETSPMPPSRPSPPSAYSDSMPRVSEEETALQQLALQLDDFERTQLHNNNSSINISAYGNASLEITTVNEQPALWVPPLPPPQVVSSGVEHVSRRGSGKPVVNYGGDAWPKLIGKKLGGLRYRTVANRPPPSLSRGIYVSAASGRLNPHAHPRDFPLPIPSPSPPSPSAETTFASASVYHDNHDNHDNSATTPMFMAAEPPSFVGTPMPLPHGSEAGQFTPLKQDPVRKHKRRHSNIVKTR
eukprot:TRINITY_DN5571_c0_g1_i1.p1 TRINITY_DN5571_c0_g1~~TRINITY_DN5571_c0_g1_i1.p1  ORF type:complete len:595 (+),score=125.82 TRINITY_DN5571_c0_g1_i1:43-1785(+)